MNGRTMTSGRGRRAFVQDKVDMSLDEIIRLNKKENQLKRNQSNVKNRLFKKRMTGSVQRGAKFRSRRTPPVPGKRKPQGVISGLAARKPVLIKRVGTLNRGAGYQKPRQRTRPFLQRSEVPYKRSDVHRRLYQQPDPQRGQTTPSPRRPFKLRRQTLPPVQMNRQESRQATFLFRRGLKVQTQVQKLNNPYVPLAKTRQWRSSATTANNGILTVSIANPTARTQPEPPSAWTLHPSPTPPAPALLGTTERKIPKGVQMEFDINSIGKPKTSMTLNERFRILKDRRAVTQTTKAGRFVTVG